MMRHQIPLQQQQQQQQQSAETIDQHRKHRVLVSFVLPNNKSAHACVCACAQSIVHDTAVICMLRESLSAQRVCHD